MKKVVTIPIKDLDLSDEIYPKVKEPKKFVKGKPVTTYLEARAQLEDALADLFAISLSSEIFSHELDAIVRDWTHVNLVESSLFPHSSRVADLENTIDSLKTEINDYERKIKELQDDVGFAQDETKKAQEEAETIKEFLLDQSQKLLTKINITADTIETEMKAIAEGMRGKDKQVMK